jgi:hypothetical protein
VETRFQEFQDDIVSTLAIEDDTIVSQIPDDDTHTFSLTSKIDLSQQLILQLPFLDFEKE